MVKMDDIKTGEAVTEKAAADRLVPPAPPKRRRTRFTRLIVIGGVVVALWLAAPWVAARLTQVHINDARIAANVVTVSSEVAGRVTAIPVLVGDSLEKGDLVAAIDRAYAQSRHCQLNGTDL